MTHAWRLPSQLLRHHQLISSQHHQHQQRLGSDNWSCNFPENSELEHQNIVTAQLWLTCEHCSDWLTQASQCIVILECIFERREPKRPQAGQDSGIPQRHCRLVYGVSCFVINTILSINKYLFFSKTRRKDRGENASDESKLYLQVRDLFLIMKIPLLIPQSQQIA